MLNTLKNPKNCDKNIELLENPDRKILDLDFNI